MKSLIVYYSYSGNTEQLVQILSEYLKTKYEVKLLKLESKNESASFIKQAVRAFFHTKAAISSFDFDVSGYDLVCFGTPVWAFAPAPAMNTFIEKCYGLTGKNILLFTTYGSGAGVNQCFRYMKWSLLKKGAKTFRRFTIQQGKLKDKAFVENVIRAALEHSP